MIYRSNMIFITLYYNVTSIPAELRRFSADFGSFRRISVIGCILVFLVTPLIPLFSSSGHTGCGYPGLLDRKNHSDMCRLWKSNSRLPA